MTGPPVRQSLRVALMFEDAGLAEGVAEILTMSGLNFRVRIVDSLQRAEALDAVVVEPPRYPELEPELDDLLSAGVRIVVFGRSVPRWVARDCEQRHIPMLFPDAPWPKLTSALRRNVDFRHSK